jgi:hypothetical protein
MYIEVSRMNAAKALSTEPWVMGLAAVLGQALAGRLEKGLFLRGSDIYDVLKHIGVTHLHQANSVITSCTYLQQGAMLSRGFAEDHKLQQSAQPTDELDRKYGIWHTIFVPHVDIHDRQGQTKAPNLFGPVLFVLDLDVLLRLPPGAEVRVTKRSPAYWYDTELDSARWFQNAEEVAQNLSPDDIHKMLAIQMPSGKLDFPGRRARIILDDPQRQVLSGVNAYTHAEARLREAAARGKVEVSIERRKCQMGCICAGKYAAWSTPVVDFYFG